MNDAEKDALADRVASLPQGAKIDFLLGMVERLENDHDRLQDELDAVRRQYESHIGTLNAGIRGLERMLAGVETERDALRADQMVDAEMEAEVIVFRRQLAGVATERDRLRTVVDALRGYLSMDICDSPEVTAVLDDLRGMLLDTDSSPTGENT
jgi:hypothetical protein